MFCKKCNSLMLPSDGTWICKRCGHEKKVQRDDSQVITSKREEKETVIISEEVDTLPKTNARCEKCDNTKAFWRIQQTRAADEPETRIYRCTKCGHTWREY